VRTKTVLALLSAGVIALSPALGRFTSGVHASGPPQHTLAAQTPDVVAHGAATLRGHYDPNAPLTLDIGLGVHNSSDLDAIIAAASDPTSPQYGHYLTNDAYLARFAPTDAEVQGVRDWATAAGLTVQSVSPDHLLVTAQAPAGTVERALGVTINSYALDGRTIRSNDRDPSVPDGLDIRAISGLSTIHRFHVMAPRAASPRALAARAATNRLRATRAGGYYPNDFRAAYNVAPVGDGAGQTIGFTLWGGPVAQSDLNTFASQTGTPAIVGGQGGANGIDWIPVNGGSSDTNELVETAMDVEYAHGVAPNSHLKYWLGDCAASGTSCNPSDTGLEGAISAAANDTSLHVVSNSWGGGEAASAADPFVTNTNASFQHAASVGTTFYFSSGDSGSWSGSSGTTQAPSYPADSPYVVSVGGTNLQTAPSTYTYSSESTWSCANYTACTSPYPAGTGGSGGGCSTIFARPSWQTGVGAATCSGRAEPDISADADPASGAYVYVQSQGQEVGGTSLAAPLWSGMAAATNRYLGANGQALMGFSAPRIYQLAANAATDARDFHDVTSGTNGYPAGAGWDEATGWGSPNLANLAADWSGTSSPTPTTAPTNTPTATATNTPTATATNTPTATATNTPTATRPASTATAASTSTSTATRPAATATQPPAATATRTTAPTVTQPPAATATKSPTPAPTATQPSTGGLAAGTHSSSIGTAGAADSYTFTPGASGSATIGTCATSAGNDYDLYVYNSAGALLASSTTSSYCEWVGVTVSAGQTYTVKTLAYSGTGLYRSAWSVGGTQVTWNVSGAIGSSGGAEYFSFPTLSARAINISTCGPAGKDFDLYLQDPAYNTLASSTTPSNCESISYTPSARGLFRLEEVSYNGAGAWSGTIKTY